jgi:hypothetical protein
MPAVLARCLANRVISSSIWSRQYAGAEQIYYGNGSEHDHTGEGTCPTHYDRNRILQCVVAGIGAALRCFPYVLSGLLDAIEVAVIRQFGRDPPSAVDHQAI